MRLPEPGRSPAGFSGHATSTWRECRAITPDTPAGRYLLEARGCALPPSNGHLRWHPRLWHPQEQRTFPALVALVTNAATGRPITLHRTWLAPDGSGKAPVEKPRLLLKGHDKAGGVVRLWPDEEVTSGLAIAEGLETALTAAAGLTPIWACIDAANLGAFPVLEGIECLTIVADHDKPNPKTGKQAGLEAAQECAQRWFAAGYEVRIWKAPMEGADLNDFAAGAAA
jgi:putative DNA primase/helicase